MGKIGYVLLGIALTVAALSLGGYRHVYKPNRDRASTQVSQSAPATRSAQSTQQRPAPGQTTTAVSRGGSSSELSTAQMIDWGLNFANIVVGAMGIWMTTRGMGRKR